MSNYCRARAARNLVYIVSFAIVRRWSEDNWKTTVRAAGATHMAGWRLRRLSASAHLRNESRRQTTTSRATERFVSIERRNGAPHPTSSNYNWSAATTDRPTGRRRRTDRPTGNNIRHGAHAVTPDRSQNCTLFRNSAELGSELLPWWITIYFIISPSLGSAN